MNIRKLIPILILSSIGCSVFAQVEIPNAPQWQVTLQVTDESGLPIAGANAYAGYYIPPPPDTTEASSRKTGLADTNGLSTLSAHSGPAIWYGADKPGFYPTAGSEFNFKSKVGDQWQPWNPTLKIVLRKTINPVPMYAKSVDYFQPTNGQPIGFDFKDGDWVEPYGRGKSKDILFTTHFDKRSKDDYDYSFTVGFPNRGDGIQGFEFSSPIGERSALRSPYEAPETGYKPEIVKTDNMRPGQYAKEIWNPKTNYVFRVQTVLDENGNVKSALYGKIYGDFDRFTYYLNPTPNDRNMEFDPKHNLINLQPREIPISAP